MCKSLPLSEQDLPGGMGFQGYSCYDRTVKPPGDLGAALHRRAAADAQDLPGMMGSVGHDCRDCTVRPVHYHSGHHPAHALADESLLSKLALKTRFTIHAKEPYKPPDWLAKGSTVETECEAS